MRSGFGLSATAAMLGVGMGGFGGPVIRDNRIGPGVKGRKRLIDRRTGKEVVLANLSRWHPDYGMTPAQHDAAKEERASGKRKFVSKEDTRRRRQGP